MESLEKSSQLTVRVEGDEVVVRIGRALLLFAVQAHPEFDGEIKKPDLFVQDIIRELRAEDEGGTTLLHQAFDRAAINAIENGSEAVDCD